MPILQEQHHTLVQRESKRFLKALSLPQSAMEDLESYAYVGLLEAMKTYDPRKKVPFEYYAVQRIRGAMIEGVGSMSAFSRSAYKQLKYLSVMHGLSQVNHQTVFQAQPIPSESLQHNDSHLLSSFQQLQQIAIMVSLETFLSKDKYKDEPAEVIANQSEFEQKRNVVSDAFAQLAADEQDLLIAVYDLRNKGDNAYSYARSKGINRSSVSRRHIRIIEKLKTLIQDQT